MIKLSRPSLMSLRIEMWWQHNHLATGTGFVVMAGSDPYLITNRHNLAGRSGPDDAPRSSHGVTPDRVRILHNVEGEIGAWEWRDEPLVDVHENPLWREHPEGGKLVDVVALSLKNLRGVDLYPYSISPSDNPPETGPSTGLNIIGFPYAEASNGGIGIWARGTVASEPDLDYGRWPTFLIDSRTRKGQSGSPVIFYSPGGGVLRKSGPPFSAAKSSTYSASIPDESTKNRTLVSSGSPRSSVT